MVEPCCLKDVEILIQHLWSDFRNGVFAIDPVKVTVVKRGSNPIWLCPHKKRKFGHRSKCPHMKMKADIRVRHLQVKQYHRPPANQQGLGERSGTGSPSRPEKGRALLTAGSQASGLQNCETVDFCCWSHLVCRLSLEQRWQIDSLPFLANSHSEQVEWRSVAAGALVDLRNFPAFLLPCRKNCKTS